MSHSVWVKRLEPDGDNSFPPIAEVKNNWCYIPIPHVLSWHELEQLHFLNKYLTKYQQLNFLCHVITFEAIDWYLQYITIKREKLQTMNCVLFFIMYKFTVFLKLKASFFVSFLPSLLLYVVPSPPPFFLPSFHPPREPLSAISPQQLPIIRHDMQYCYFSYSH